MSTKLSEHLHLRITRDLWDALRQTATKLRVRPGDIARMAIAQTVAKLGTDAQSTGSSSIGKVSVLPTLGATSQASGTLFNARESREEQP